MNSVTKVTWNILTTHWELKFLPPGGGGGGYSHIWAI